MTFVHTSDIYLGNRPDINKSWSNDRANEIKNSFFSCIKKCKELKADLLLISGNLFDKQPITKELNEINEQFKIIQDTYVIIVTGENDAIKNNSIILNYKFNHNVKFISSNTITKIELKKINVVIYGISCFENDNVAKKINTIEEPENKEIINILIANANDRIQKVNYDILSQKKFTYCALGGFRNHIDLFNHKIIYPGSIEPLGIEDTGTHGICIGDINTITKRLESFHFEPISKTNYITINISIDVYNSNDEIIQAILNEINKRGTDNIYQIIIEGYKNPYIQYNFDSLKIFKILDILDNSEPKYNFNKILAENNNNIIGAYIRTFYNNINNLNSTQKKALYYGLNALLKSTENE